MDNLTAGISLFNNAEHLIQGGFSFENIGEAAQLFGGAKDFFHGLKHQFGDEGGQTTNGLAAQSDFAEDWSREGKSVFMFSGCKDTQTSADAYISGRHVGAMSWAFLETMKHDYRWDMSYIQVSLLDDGRWVSSVMLTGSRSWKLRGICCSKIIRRFRS